MNKYITGRIAVLDTAKYFTKCGWTFREKTDNDRGIDAEVEIPLNESGQVKFFSMQIKGGKSHFRRKAHHLTIYFHERHYAYWNAIVDNHPFFIILQDNISNVIYWQEYHPNYISKTPKNWKLDIPITNILNSDAKQRIMDIVYRNTTQRLTPVITHVAPVKKVKVDLIIGFSYSQKKNATLYLTLEYKNDLLILDLLYKPKKGEWDAERSVLNSESSDYYLMKGLTSHIHSIFNQTNRSIKSFYALESKIKEIVKGDIRNVEEYLFDYKNKDNDIPKYGDFVKAFESHTGLKSGQYKVKPFDYCIHFATDEGFFEMNCYEGLCAQLRRFIDERRYEEILTMTDEQIWNEIYFDPGIEKYRFIPVMQNELELYWKRAYKDRVLCTDYLDEKREELWRIFSSFKDLYNDTVNIIELAHSFDNTVFYALAVISMTLIYDSETCFSEYCDFEFDSTENQWESICLNEDDDNATFFYIRPSEF